MYNLVANITRHILRVLTLYIRVFVEAETFFDENTDHLILLK